MGWFKKDEEQIAEGEIPELPELPNPDEFSLPQLPSPDKSSLPKASSPEDISLPKLPTSSLSVESGDMPQLPKLPELRNKNAFRPTVAKQEIRRPRQEMQRSQFGVIETKPRQELPRIRTPPEIREHYEVREPPEIDEISSRSSPVKNVEPIYVRLDKFESSLQSIEEIKIKIEEVEEILKKTKEIKQKEEQELETWEKEIHIIKSRINMIDKDIFKEFD